MICELRFEDDGLFFFKQKKEVVQSGPSFFIISKPVNYVCFRNILITILYFHTGYERRLTGNFYQVKRFFQFHASFALYTVRDFEWRTL